MSSFRTFLHTTFHDVTSTRYRIVNTLGVFVTIVSVLAITLETVDGLAAYNEVLRIIEYVAVCLFSLEYVLRIIADKQPLHYIISFWGAVDLLSVLPTFLGLGNLTFLKSARVLRTIRMVRVAKIARPEIQYNEQHAFNTHRFTVKTYFIGLVVSLFVFGILAFFAQGSQSVFVTIVDSIVWTSKVLLGGAPAEVLHTTAGEVLTIVARFVGLLLFGLLLVIVGGVLKKLFFGSPDLE
jgi:voltage-gated potassium channel